MSLLTNMAKRAGLPWDCVISAELFHHYKPDREAYLGCADLLGVAPDELMLVAAHPGDLQGGARCRVEDGVRRPAAGVRPRAARRTGTEPGEFDVAATDFVDLAEQLGA